MWPHQIEDASVGETCQLCEGNGQEIERQSQGLSMKISSAQHVTILWKNKRIIGNRSQLAFKNVGAILQGIAYSAENLGRAAHCIGVLYSGAISMPGVDFAITYHFSHSPAPHLLPLLPPPPLNSPFQY